MRQEYKERWRREANLHAKRMRTPSDLLARKMPAEDFVDAAIIGGTSIADVLAGRVSESEIPSEIKTAFHLQYPQHTKNFVDALRDLAHDPDKLVGLISGIKGKLFEIHYVDWLNHGALPNGWTAELASAANNPGWDIIIRDDKGRIAELLQAKATDSISYVKEAFERYPDIDVVVPRELYEQLANDPSLADHILSSHEYLADLNETVAGSVADASSGLHPLPFPVIGVCLSVGLAMFQCWARYRSGKVSLVEAFQLAGERATVNVLASSIGWLSSVTIGPFVGPFVSVVVRFIGRQALHNRGRRKVLRASLEAVQQSTRKLQELNTQSLISGTAWAQ